MRKLKVIRKEDKMSTGTHNSLKHNKAE